MKSIFIFFVIAQLSAKAQNNDKIGANKPDSVLPIIMIGKPPTLTIDGGGDTGRALINGDFSVRIKYNPKTQLLCKDTIRHKDSSKIAMSHSVMTNGKGYAYIGENVYVGDSVLIADFNVIASTDGQDMGSSGYHPLSRTIGKSGIQTKEKTTRLYISRKKSTKRKSKK